MEQKVTAPWMKGLIISLIMIVFSLTLYFTNQMMNKSLGYVQWLILIGGIIWADINFAKQMNGNVTFGNVFAHGFKTTAAVIVIMVVYSFIAVKFIYPELIDMIATQSRAEMEKKGGLSAEDMDKGIQMVRKFFTVFMIGGIIIMFGICGAIASLIGAAVAKKNPNYNPLEQSS